MSDVWIPLGEIAHGRSGDKGDHLNIGLIAHRPEWLDLLIDAVTEARLHAWFGPMLKGDAVVYRMNGIGAINCMLHHALEGGGTTSLRLDAQGKSWGQSILRLRVPVNRDEAVALGLPLNAATFDEAGRLAVV